jgi:hypothetical protein
VLNAVPERTGMHGRLAVDNPTPEPIDPALSQPVTEAGQQPDSLPVLTNEQITAYEQLERHRKHLASFADLEEFKRAVALTRIANRNPNTARAYKNAHREWRVSLVLLH